MTTAVERYLSQVPYIAMLRHAPWGFSVRRIVAAATAVSTDYGDVWEGGGNLAYPASAELLEVVSTSADDNAAGTGARTVQVIGLDANYLEVEETVLLNGLTTVVTAQLYLRVNGFRVVTAGSGGAVAGELTLQASPGGAVRSVISSPSYNTALSSHFTVPAAKTGYIIAAKYTADDQTTRFGLCSRGLGGVFESRDVYQTGGTPTEPPFLIPIEVAEKSDLKVIARRPTVQSALVLVAYDLVLAPKTLAATRSFGQPAR